MATPSVDLCYQCDTESSGDVAECSTCSLWFHRSCLGLTKSQYKAIKADDSDTPYLCNLCSATQPPSRQDNDARPQSPTLAQPDSQPLVIIDPEPTEESMPAIEPVGQILQQVSTLHSDQVVNNADPDPVQPCISVEHPQPCISVEHPQPDITNVPMSPPPAPTQPANLKATTSPGLSLKQLEADLRSREKKLKKREEDATFAIRNSAQNKTYIAKLESDITSLKESLRTSRSAVNSQLNPELNQPNIPHQLSSQITQPNTLMMLQSQMSMLMQTVSQHQLLSAQQQAAIQSLTQCNMSLMSAMAHHGLLPSHTLSPPVFNTVHPPTMSAPQLPHVSRHQQQPPIIVPNPDYVVNHIPVAQQTSNEHLHSSLPRAHQTPNEQSRSCLPVAQQTPNEQSRSCLPVAQQTSIEQSHSSRAPYHSPDTQEAIISNSDSPFRSIQPPKYDQVNPAHRSNGKHLNTASKATKRKHNPQENGRSKHHPVTLTRTFVRSDLATGMPTSDTRAQSVRPKKRDFRLEVPVHRNRIDAAPVSVQIPDHVPMSQKND